MLFGTPSAEPYLREGFYTEAGGAAADRFLWSKGEAELALTFAGTASRAAVLELRPYEGVRGQRLEVRLNDAPVESFTLNDNRHRYLVRLPAGRAEGRRQPPAVRVRRDRVSGGTRTSATWRPRSIR